MPPTAQISDSASPGALSLVLIGPDEQRRRAVVEALSGSPVGVIREITSYPSDLDELQSP